MEQKLQISWEIKKGERVYSFLIPAQAPYGEIFDCGVEIMNAALESQKKAAEQIKQQQQEVKDGCQK